MMQNIIFVLAIVMVAEGIFPFLSPKKWKKTLLRILMLNETVIRWGAFFSMIFGAFLLSIVHPTLG